jgi:hypothetical protein
MTKAGLAPAFFMPSLRIKKRLHEQAFDEKRRGIAEKCYPDTSG